jgi:hypothetical protein
VGESGRKRGRKRREGLRARATAELTYINGEGNDVTRLPFSSASASAAAQADDVLRSGACCYLASSIQSILLRSSLSFRTLRSLAARFLSYTRTCLPEVPMSPRRSPHPRPETAHPIIHWCTRASAMRTP